jgi:hypothetical protein
MLKSLLALLFATTSLAENTPRSVADIRDHYQLLGAEQTVLYEVTEIRRSSDLTSEHYVLVRDEGHGDFILRSLWTYKDQTSLYRISDVKDRAFIQASAKLPFTSKTGAETLDEIRANPSIKDLPSIVKIETNGGRWDGVEKDWDEKALLRSFRHQLRQTTDFYLLEGIERMRGTFLGTDAASMFYAVIARFVIYDATDDADAPKVTTRNAAPDCDFDASFGFPCSARQRERVVKAAKDGKELLRY